MYNVRGKGPRISANIRGICPGYNSHGYLPMSRAYATDVCRYPRALAVTEGFVHESRGMLHYSALWVVVIS